MTPSSAPPTSAPATFRRAGVRRSPGSGAPSTAVRARPPPESAPARGAAFPAAMRCDLRRPRAAGRRRGRAPASCAPASRRGSPPDGFAAGAHRTTARPRPGRPARRRERNRRPSGCARPRRRRESSARAAARLSTAARRRRRRGARGSESRPISVRRASPVPRGSLPRSASPSARARARRAAPVASCQFVLRAFGSFVQERQRRRGDRRVALRAAAGAPVGALGQERRRQR